MRDVRQTVELDFEAFLFCEHDFFGMLAKKIQQVRRMRRGDDLNRRPLFATTLWITEAIKRILEPTQEPRVESAVDFLETDQFRRIGKMGEEQEGESDERPLRRLLRWNFV